MGEENFEELFKSILDLHRSVISIFFKDFEEIFPLPPNMNFTQMKGALILSFHGSMPMSKLSKMLNLEKGSFSTVAAKMIKNGLARKEHSVEDKRVYNLVLTQEGKLLTDKFKEAHWKFAAKRLEKLSKEEQSKYFTMVEGLNSLNHKIKS